MSRAWKQAELEVARYFCGMRRVRISYAERGSDIIHSLYSIEVKYGKQIPKKALLGKCCKFLDYAFAQAISYNPTLVPIVALKTPQMRGFIIVRGYPTDTEVIRANPESLQVSPHPPTP